jgi:hypothetical protein
MKYRMVKILKIGLQVSDLPTTFIHFAGKKFHFFNIRKIRLGSKGCFSSEMVSANPVYFALPPNIPEVLVLLC